MNNDFKKLEGIESCIEHLECLKAEIEWDFPLSYQLDLELAINILKSLKEGI